VLIGIGAVPQTTAEYVEFQRTMKTGLPMFPSGHPDPATLINAGVYDPAASWSAAQASYLQGGKKPSTFLRDLRGASNQVPSWGWLAVGGVFLLLGYLSYRAEAKL